MHSGLQGIAVEKSGAKDERKVVRWRIVPVNMATYFKELRNSILGGLLGPQLTSRLSIIIYSLKGCQLLILILMFNGLKILLTRIGILAGLKLK